MAVCPPLRILPDEPGAPSSEADLLDGNSRIGEAQTQKEVQEEREPEAPSGVEEESANDREGGNRFESGGGPTAVRGQAAADEEGQAAADAEGRKEAKDPADKYLSLLRPLTLRDVVSSTGSIEKETGEALASLSRRAFFDHPRIQGATRLERAADSEPESGTVLVPPLTSEQPQEPQSPYTTDQRPRDREFDVAGISISRLRTGLRVVRTLDPLVLVWLYAAFQAAIRLPR